MKKLFMVLAATVVCGACLFTSCKKDEENDLKLEEKIIGKWMMADVDGHAELTNNKSVLTFLSPTQAVISTSRANSENQGWVSHLNASVVMDGNKMTITGQPNEHITIINEITVSSITATHMEGTFKHNTLRDGEVISAIGPMEMRWVKITADYKQAILGTWQGRCTSEGSVFDDGQEHRWQYNADGTYVYYRHDGQAWVPYGDDFAEYFVDGNLLCTRWRNSGEQTENREWWEITVDGTQMHWTALRQNPDGTTFTATFEMERVD